jgi:parallel beta-helix repeat protein
VSKKVKAPLSSHLFYLDVLLLLGFLGFGCGATTSHTQTPQTASAFGNNYYVSNSGSDVADGSQSQPWQTIKHAAQVVQAGNTVHVLPGTYYESPECKNNGTSAAPIRFVSDTKWGAKVVGDGVSNWGFRVDGDYSTIEAFDITNVNPTGHVGIETEGNYDSIIGNHVHNINPNGGHDGLGGAGIINGTDITKGYLDVIGNVVHDVGDLNFPWYQVHGIYYGSKGGHIYNNMVFRTQGWGIHLWHAATNITISNNTIFNNMEGGILVGDGDYPCPQCVTDDSTIVTNNIVVYNLAHNYNGSLIGGFGIIETGNTGANNRYDNNLLYGNQSGPISLQNGNLPGPTVLTDPMFVNYRSDGTGDYHVQTGSPAINAGTSEGPAPTYDIDGIARPPWDVGAYEYP